MSKQTSTARESLMTQEYLFLSSEKIEEIKTYHVKGAFETYTQIKNTDCWIVSFTLKGKTIDNAKILSNANDYIVANYKPTVLTNGCAVYFTKRLYPFVADFERGLRKLLYLKTAISESKTAKNHIRNLEDKNLEDIKYILYYDKNFYEGVYKTINDKKRFQKEEIISAINGIDEKTVWQALFPNNPPENLKDRFHTIMLYRNDVMHSHNINFERYESIMSLFEQVNDEILSAINTIVEQEFDTDNALEFDQSLSEAIAAQQEYVTFEQNYISLLESYINSPAVEAARRAIANMDLSAAFSALSVADQAALKIAATINSPEVQRTAQQLARYLSQLDIHSNAYKTLTKDKKDSEKSEKEEKNDSPENDKGDKE